MKPVVLVFCFFLLINVTSSGGHLSTSDGLQNFLVAESMALKHSAKLYPDIPSVQKLHVDIRRIIIFTVYYQTHVYDTHTPLKPTYVPHCCLVSAIAVPFYYLAILFSASPTATTGFVDSLVLSLISLVIFCFSVEIYGSKKIAFILGVIFAVCSFAWPYNSSLFPQPLEGLLIIASAFFIYISSRRIISNTSGIREINHKGIYFAGLGALFLGLSLFAHPSSLIMIPGFIVYSIFSMKNNGKRLGAFLVVFAIMVLFVGLVNYLRYGSFTDFGYGTAAQALAIHNGWVGLIGLLASPGFGLIFYFPVAILLPLAFKFMYQKNKQLFFLCAYVIIVSWVYFGTLSIRGLDPSTWTGTAVWGPRYLVPTVPFVTIVLGALLRHLKTRLFLKITTIILCVTSFYINLIGSLEWYYYGYSYAWLKLGLLKLDSNAKVTGVNSMDAITWDPIYSPIVLHQTLLSSDYLSRHGGPPGLAPCLYDNYIFCNFGIIPILLLLSAVAVLAIFILVEVSGIKLEVFVVSVIRSVGAKLRN